MILSQIIVQPIAKKMSEIQIPEEIDSQWPFFSAK